MNFWRNFFRIVPMPRSCFFLIYCLLLLWFMSSLVSLFLFSKEKISLNIFYLSLSSSFFSFSLILYLYLFFRLFYSMSRFFRSASLIEEVTRYSYSNLFLLFLLALFIIFSRGKKNWDSIIFCTTSVVLARKTTSEAGVISNEISLCRVTCTLLIVSILLHKGSTRNKVCTFC